MMNIPTTALYPGKPYQRFSQPPASNMAKPSLHKDKVQFGMKPYLSAAEKPQEVMLSTGTLQVKPKAFLEQVIDWGSRINKKRGFLFVSKVLGKHIPVQPQKMEKVYVDMANQLRPLIKQEPTLVIGMAETATGLGHGVFDKIHRFNPNSIYMHTTRYNLAQPRMLNFVEEHCHAPSHILYQPQNPEIAEKLKQVKNIVVVDDEISTGNTLVNFAQQLQALKKSGALPELKPDGIVSSTILQWDKSKPVLKQAHITTKALYTGDFTFQNKMTKQMKVPVVKSVTSNPNPLDAEIPHNFGRFGIDKINVPLEQYFTKEELKDLKGKKVLLLGTGEFMYPAYLLAKQLKGKGVNTFVQATTRSPINTEGAIGSKIGFQDNYHEEIDNFLYNLKEGYDKILVCYETPNLPRQHQKELFEKLKSYCQDCQPLYLSPN